MAVLTAQGISEVAIELLTRTLVLPRTVTTIPGEEFSGSNGDTITVRVPQPGTAREQTAPGQTITYDDVTEIPVPVTVKHLYHAKRISDQEATLRLEDFARQVTRVQVSAVATGAEQLLANKMNDLPVDVGNIGVADVDDAVLEARTALGRADAPNGDRWAACSPEFAELVFKQETFSRADAAGDQTALREAIIGRWRGFMWVESNGIEPGTAVLYHQSGFVFANRVPVAPRGARESATTSAGGIGMRQIFQYAPDILSDSSVLSTFAGAAVVADNQAGTDIRRAFKLGLVGTS
ncbi:hypothetical protein MXD61_06845 [Frankia sp. AgPm24]|uniref:P22 phage major capsid protein family protein n=1 Tax=Frankia sp. AgPm24 TaxID=631128 RepID=UPI00200F598E|nr:P22 phage major capsid protein family protein [Frankia sp. AgPm24]MCK9921608.1 hypothetical protein [Frankia sp. AgPm24]